MILLLRHLKTSVIFVSVSCFFAAIAGHAASLSVTPAAVSNTYDGVITLQIGGLTNGEPVVIQKFMDANGNGAIDVADPLWQQFNLADGQASVFHDGATAVTNLVVPGDLDSTGGHITADLSLPAGGFEQSIVAKYLFKLSSPSGNFQPVTNSFTVTNFPFAQSFTGSVTANSTNVPGAIVLLFQTAGANLEPEAGAVANNSGNYSIQAAPGDYLLVAFKPGYVANVGTSPPLTLGSGSTINTNLSLISADRTISGRFHDASNSVVGLPGILVPLESQNGLLTVCVTDTNGDFTAGVTSDQWKIDAEDAAISVHGYVRSQGKAPVDATGGSVSGVTIALPKATALFYGSVKDSLDQPMAGISLFSQDVAGQFEQSATTGTSGNYFAGAINGSPWSMGISSDRNPTNYVFSEPSLFGGTNLAFNQALRVDFTSLPATQRITGHVQQSNGQPVPLVQVFANAIIGSAFYATQVDTDTNGDFSLNVANNGNWSVSVSCQGGDDSLDVILGNGNYQCPNTQIITITNNNGVADFTIQPCGGIQVLTSSPLPNGEVNSYYSIQLNAASCNGNFNWSLNSGAVPPGLNLYSGGAFNGTPTTNGTFNFSVHVSDGGSSSTNASFSITINPAPTPPTIFSPAHFSNGQFQMTVNGSSGQQYTVQMSTNLSSTNWIPILVTNPPVNSFLITDPNATNAARFYRILLGP